MEEKEQIKDWYTEYKEKKLERDIKRCNAFAIVSGTVATLSSLIVAGNLALGNGLEALQVGGSTLAMAAYTICYSKMSTSYKDEQKAFQERQTNPKGFIKDRLETLRHELEISDTWLSMDYLVTGGFYLSSLGHIIELLTMPSAPQIVTSVTGAALAGLVATLYLKLIKRHKLASKAKKTEIEGLEELEELERLAKEPIPELIEPEGVLELEAPQEPQTLSEEEMIERKGGMSVAARTTCTEGPTKIKKNPPKRNFN